MSSLRRLRQIGQGQFHKWETPGDELEGTWQGSHEGRFGSLGTLETAAKRGQGPHGTGPDLQEASMRPLKYGPVVDYRFVQIHHRRSCP